MSVFFVKKTVISNALGRNGPTIELLTIFVSPWPWETIFILVNYM